MQMKKSHRKKIRIVCKSFSIPCEDINYSHFTGEIANRMQENVLDMDLKTLLSYRWCLMSLKAEFDPNNYTSILMVRTSILALLLAILSCVLALLAIVSGTMEPLVGGALAVMMILPAFILAIMQTTEKKVINRYIKLHIFFRHMKKLC